MDMKPRIVRKSVALNPQEHEAVAAYAQAMGLDFSSALRAIVNEWVMLRAERERIAREGLRMRLASGTRQDGEDGVSAPPLSA